MFKNRVRTAALAGAVAVATGVSGLAVPAFAEDNVVAQTQGDGFNPADNSAAEEVKALDNTEEALLKATGATKDYIDGHAELDQIIEEVLQDAEDGIDPSEEATYGDFKKQGEVATQELAKARKNVQDARAAVKFAKQKDDASDAAWKNVDKKKAELNAAQSAAEEAISAKVDAVNAEGQKGGLEDLQAPSPASVDEIKAALESYEEAYDHAGERDADQAEDNFIPRSYLAPLEELIATTKAQLKKVEDAEAALDKATAAAKDAAREAQKSDVLVRQALLDRARAQVHVLRLYEARFTVLTRVIELRESDADRNITIDGKDITLRQAYWNVLPTLNENTTKYADSLSETEKNLLDGWNGDLDNFEGAKEDGEAKAFDAMRTATKTNAYENSFDAVEWEEALKLVLNKDNEVTKQIAAELEAAEQEKNEDDAQTSETPETPEAPADNEQTENPNKDPKDKSSKLSPLGIAGIVLGVLGAVAAIFPFLGKQLNLQLPQLPQLPKLPF
ncbi:hypothetical protein L8V01_07930 [Corynebacterium sp. c8Ua_181]|uniref:Uncharacterized protein n=1 Tax=Corynebacterium curieae TaxID=2913500 RepID=A0A9X3RTS3_9CORY|nr:hypothetical protein [Corynebacterium curieae]MCZ9307402.1 hypothetical protein [Corynebacterium curieae]MDV2424083.1 hypothetical protein [Corynebacterium curieae]